MSTLTKEAKETKEILKDILHKDIVFPKLKKRKKKKVKKLILHKELVVFDIGSRYIKVVEGKVDIHGIKLKRAFLIDTPKDSVDNGSILNKLSILKVIKELTEEKGIKTNKVVFVNNSTSIINRNISIPKIYDEDLRTLVTFEIQKFLPINMNDYIIQYYDPYENKGDTEKQNVLSIIYPYKMIKQYYELCKEAKMIPVALDVSFNSAKKLIEYSMSEVMEGRTIAAIDIGYDDLYISIYDKGILKFTRIVRKGCKQIDRYISEYRKVNMKEAEVIRSDIGLDYQELNDDKEISEAITEYIETWVEEINRIIQFYKNKNHGQGVEEIFIYGGGSMMTNVDRYLEDKLNISVKKINKLPKVTLPKNHEDLKVELYLDAIGALLRY